MRDFGTTSEPSGAAKSPPPERARFVVQEHHATRLHWDLRLEHEGALASWAIPNGIPEAPDENRKAVHTEDHPLEYLEFHGEIPRGQYGAGTMSIWDRGTYECHKWREAEVMVTFHGERLRGRYVLFRAGADEKDWMIHRMDPPEDAERVPPPDHAVPMGARAGGLPEDDAAHGYEVRWAGMRVMAYSLPGRLRLERAPGDDVTADLPGLRRLNRALGSHTAVLDGVVVAFGPDGRPDPERLARRARRTPIAFIAVDLLHVDGRSLLDEPYADRRQRLAGLGLEGESWRTPAHHEGDGEAVLAAARANGLPGVLAKRLDGSYRPGRRDWIAAGAPVADPDPPDWYARIPNPAPVVRVRAAGDAKLVRAMAERLGLRAYVKTDGAGGFDVAVPVAGDPGPLGDALVRTLSGEGIDVALVRAPTAPYTGGSVPLDWDEIDEPPPAAADSGAVRALLTRRGDPWAEAVTRRQVLPG